MYILMLKSNKKAPNRGYFVISLESRDMATNGCLWLLMTP